MIFKSNCSSVGKLLPLYAAGDLRAGERRTRKIAAHLRACRECARRAAEFNESRNMVRALTASPSFDAAFFDEIRSAVRVRIEARESIASPLAIGIFRRKWMYATPLALLLAILSLLVVYTRLERTSNDSRPSDSAIVRQDALHQNALPETRRAVEHSAPQPDADETLSSRTPAMPGDARNSQVTNTRASFIRGRRERAISRANSNTTEAYLAAAPPAQVEMTNEPEEPAASDLARNDITQATANDAGEAEDQPLRIEFQTSDPTIRIIWLAPRPTPAPMN